MFFDTECGLDGPVHPQIAWGQAPRPGVKRGRESFRFTFASDERGDAALGCSPLHQCTHDGVALRRPSVSALAQPAHDFIHAASHDAALWRMESP